ncbi:glycosyltransferase family 39 protein [Streptacidiphilus jiangxiensis]|uniref:4-amino-4-deoxy-L-arabinose transferase n=1 Tax=Streptacidiphilus jiangxiensis TaxID=235985 RepID=A0A1H7MGW3_STRJI|nr:glycosyltransferase family 39 protein [Streptacidiphilus jiangxiensis]SEL09857.1 4-amino-4-deoxy-L-arabinose transferase [Streptacidiphilus jiangxiensis]
MASAVLPGSDTTVRRRGGRRRRAAEPTPPWLRAALAVVLLTAAWLYGWGLDGASLHPYYTAAVRGMAGSWHAFLYGSLDSGGTITVDKLPGALWLQALSVRLFGLHIWAVALPQAVEGVATVWALFRIVRAWAGPVAGLLAALALLVTPIAAALARHNIADTLLTLLLVLAAGAALRACRTGQSGPLLVCALWVGLAFQAKMLQAWLLLPVFGGLYLYAAPGPLRRRVVQVLAAGATTLLASCLWVLLVWFTPAADRPYVDGTTGNNPFALVFGYNGLSRFGGGNGSGLGSVAGTAASRPTGGAGLTALTSHSAAPQISWFLPVAVLALVLGLLARRGRERTDGVRTGYLLWGGWVLVNYLVFAASSGIHAYYTVVLAPAFAALAGAGAVAAWERFGAARTQQQRYPILGVVVSGVLWAVVVDGHFSTFHRWLVPVVGALGLAGVGALAQGRDWGVWPSLAAVVLSPLLWSLSVLTPQFAGSATSPMAGPVGSGYLAAKYQRAAAPVAFAAKAGRYAHVLDFLQKHQGTAYYLVATQSAEPAEPLLRGSAAPELVMGGFTGNTPFPTAEALAAEVASGRVRYGLLIANRPQTDASRWIAAHCRVVPPATYGEPGPGTTTLYDCAKG